MIGIWIKALRVNQWTKNAAVMLAWFFSVADSSQAALARGFGSFMMAVGMTAAFCLVSSAFYLLNDVSDYDADRLHPQKRLRPVAADLISKIAAVKAALVLFACGVLFPSLVVMIYPGRTIAFGTIMLYSVIQCFYSGFLKHIPYVDVFVIAFGFVLRAVAGAAVIDAYISNCSSARSHSRCSWRFPSATTSWCITPRRARRLRDIGRGFSIFSSL